MFDTSNWEFPMSRPPDRLIRLVEDGDPQLNGSLVCHFDPEKNILRINRKYYNVLSEKEKQIVWRSEASLTFQQVEAIIERRRQR